MNEFGFVPDSFLLVFRKFYVKINIFVIFTPKKGKETPIYLPYLNLLEGDTLYIFKNALRCICRAKGRNVLIGIIVFVIALSACIGLSIRRSAEKAKTETLETMSVTASISFDRRGAMENMSPPEMGNGQRPEGGFDREQFSLLMGESDSLTLEEYEKYSDASTVKDFYYTADLSLNGNDSLEPVSNENDSADSETETPKMPSGDFGDFGGVKDFIKGADSDFTLIGVSGENAMTDFLSGNAKVTEGEIFTEGTDSLDCIISEELAVYNDLSVDDEITLINPNLEEETYTLKVVGLFENSTANQNSFSLMGMTATDPANKIYISYNALNGIVTTSKSVSETLTDDNGREYETALSESIDATYSFANVKDYETFAEEVYEMGLSDSYTVSSADLTEFENSMAPLETLSQTAGYFLIVILIIGAVILVVLNIFSVRERKYEIGVLTAMGMRKQKVALQFLSEIFVVTLSAVIVGGGIGAVASVPVANTLLESQIEAQSTRRDNIEQGFGRVDKGNMQMPDNNRPPNMGGLGDKFQDFAQNTADYVDEISSATDFVVLLQLLGIAVVLTVIAGGFSVFFIMRYEPLKILSNRD